MAAVQRALEDSFYSFKSRSEKHDVLYNRARNILSQRQRKRPWFNLNFLLEANYEDDLETFVPNDSKGFQPLESLVICEDYFKDEPLSSHEFQIGEFWDYLFSSDWRDGMSVRVLEGRLLSMILAELLVLEKMHQVVHHKTFAFARNTRPRSSCLKQSSNKPSFIGENQETLLLEFTYYGHYVNRIIQSEVSGTTQYAGSSSTTCTSSCLWGGNSDETVINMEPWRLPAVESTFNSETTFPNMENNDRKRPQTERRKLLTRRQRSSLQQQNRSSAQSDAKGDNRQRHVHIPRNKTGDSINSGNSTSSIASGFPDKLSLERFICTEKVPYLGDFCLDDDSSSSSETSSSSESDDGELEVHGDEFYLGDQHLRKLVEGDSSVLARLRKRNQERVRERMKERSELKEAVQAFQDESMRRPQFTPITKEDIERESKKLPIKVMNKVPDFMEFLSFLKDDQRESRKRAFKVKFKHERLAIRYNILSEQDVRNLADGVGGVTDSKACKQHVLDNALRQSHWRRGIRASGALKKMSSLNENPTTNPLVSKLKTGSTSIAQSALGTSRAGKFFKLKLEKRKRKVSSGTSKEQLEKPLPEIKVTIPEEITVKLLRQQAKTGPRKAPVLKEIEKRKPGTFVVTKPDPETSSDSETDDDIDDEDEEQLFDSKKLNLRYSMERLRRKRMIKKEKPKFYSVLKKYYRMQAVLKAFGKGDKKQSSTSPGWRKRGSKLPKMKGTTKEPVTRTMVVGRMKWFRFLNQIGKPVISSANMPGVKHFESYSMKLFRENLERALDEFVVRREIVVTSNTHICSTSITFSRKTAFRSTKQRM